VGYGKAHNIALTKSLDQSLYHLVLNPDVSFEPDALEKIFHFMEAHPQAGLDEDELVFEEPGDLVNVADVSSLTLSPWDETQHTWGISLMKLQANLPATLPGQNVTFLLFGSVAIDNAVVSNVDGARLQLQAQGDVNVYSAASADQEVIATMADSSSANFMSDSSFCERSSASSGAMP